MKVFAFAAAFTLVTVLTGAPAHAGETMLQKNGQTISLYCNGDGCFVQNGADGWINVSDNRRKLGPGGAKNFKKWERAYKKEGWKTA